jgi:hypothetical protein
MRETLSFCGMDGEVDHGSGHSASSPKDDGTACTRGAQLMLGTIVQAES